MSTFIALLVVAILGGCASFPTNACQGAAGYTAARVIGYPYFLLVLGFTNRGCYEALKNETD